MGACQIFPLFISCCQPISKRKTFQITLNIVLERPGQEASHEKTAGNG